MTFRKSLFCIALTVIVLTLSLPPYDMGFLRYFALVPLLFCIAKTENSLSRVQRILILWLAIFLFLLWQYTEILYLHPLDWAGIESRAMSILVVSILWFALALCLSLAMFPLLFALSKKLFFLFPIFFALSEYFRSVFYSIITFGPGSTVADIWPFGFLGLSAHTSGALLFFAPFVNIYGFSFFITLVNLAIFYLLFGILLPRQKIRFGIFSFLILSLIIIEYIPFPQTPQTDSEQVGIIALNEKNPVQLRYTDAYYLATLPKRLDTLATALSKHPNTQMILFSENSQFLKTLETKASSDTEAIENILFKTQSGERLIIDGEHDRERRASVALASMSTGEKFFVYKNVLMPLGEYQPYLLKWATTILGQEDFYNTLASQKNTESVHGGTKTIETSIGKIAIVACSEIFSSDIYAQIRTKHPDLIVHQQRLAHFRDAPKLFDQTLALSQIRAATLRTFIVGAVDNGGFSYAISPYGELMAQSSAEDGYLYVEVPMHPSPFP